MTSPGLVLRPAGGSHRSVRRRRVSRRTRLARWAALAGGLVVLLALVLVVRWAADAPARQVAASLDDALAGAPVEVAQFYEARANRPFWVEGRGIPPHATLRPEAARMAKLAAAALPSEIPAAVKARALAAVTRAQSGDAADLARAEVALSTAFAEALRSMQPAGALAFIDPDLPARPGPREALEQAASSADLAGYLDQLQAVNPLYAALRAQWSPTHPQAALIEANLHRLRVLPPFTARRYLVVNPASQELALYEDGKLTDTMRVVVGRRDEPTPMMAGLMTHLILNPYWEVPVDIVRESVAPHVMREGAGYLAGRRFQVLSDWTETAEPMSPAAVDWEAVAAGGTDVPVRQLPGGDNMMGGVKFMLPNELGIYLHDTPDRWAFDARQRLISAGCVRLERAQDLARWLLGKPPAATKANQRVELFPSVPVYITYQTAEAGPRGLVLHPDVYGRDRR